MYYFAYGSNMDEDDLKKSCIKNGRRFPQWRFVGVAYLENYQLTFNYYSTGRSGGAANIMPKPNSKVYGLLFEVKDQYDLETLRKKEGYHSKIYDEIYVSVVGNNEVFKDVFTYKVKKERESHEHQKPTKYYMNLILQNARKYKFPQDYIEYIESIETQ